MGENEVFKVVRTGKSRREYTYSSLLLKTDYLNKTYYLMILTWWIDGQYLKAYS